VTIAGGVRNQRLAKPSPTWAASWGVPLGWEQAGANRNDCVLLDPTLDAIDGRGLLDEIGTLHLDRGYDDNNHNNVAARCAELGLDELVCAKRRKNGAVTTKLPVPLGMRWAVERTNSWLSNLGIMPQHRPVPPPAPRPVRPRRRLHAHRQAHQVGRPLAPRNLTCWRAL
jgi:hypothetical protein